MSVIVVLERAQAMPTDGAVAAFDYGRGFGVIEGVLAALGIPFREETPQAWQKVVLKGVGGADTKEQARLVVQRLMPHIPIVPKGCRVPDKGLVDAAAISLYARGQGNAQVYVGIDPGACGGLVAIRNDGFVVFCETMPVIDIGVKRKGKVGKKHIVDGVRLAALFREHLMGRGLGPPRRS